MHLGGKTLLSKSTVLTSRSLLILSLSIIVVKWFDMDVADFSILGIDPGNRLDESVIVVSAFLAISHVVNWVGDTISGNGFGLFAQRKPLEGIGDVEKERSYIRAILSELERLKKDSGANSTDAIDSKLEYLVKGMVQLDRSGWRFSIYALFYVVAWNFILPLGMIVFALSLLCYA
ncbi:MAG: hypothetical protein AAFN80_04315 [Pseudomonadota bacterium]